MVVIGGANSAGQAAVYFAGYAERVTMLVRSSLQKSMSHYLIEQIAALPNDRRAHGRAGGRRRGRRRAPAAPARSAAPTARRPSRTSTRASSSSARRRARTGSTASSPATSAGFILAGADAQAAGWPLKRDPYLLETTVPGVFVAGDVRARSIKRVASAVGEGSMAVSLIHEYLDGT